MSDLSPQVGKLLLDLGINLKQFNRLVARSSHTYKVYSIPKKNGGKRIIAQPAKETKYLQYWLIENIFSQLPVSKNAKAYSKNTSIKDNARAHSKNKYMLKLDFTDFFNSITYSDIERHFSKYLSGVLTESEVILFSKICCVSLPEKDQACLSIGAPSSPLISNSIMYEFDVEVDTWCRGNKVIYTRYADDLVFSTNIKETTVHVEKKIRAMIAGLSSVKLSLNESKTTHLSKKHHRTVTGLTISNDNKVTLGRDKKREISKDIFLYVKGYLNSEQIDSLQGKLGFAKHIDPLFVNKLSLKHGADVLKKLFSHRKDLK